MSIHPKTGPTSPALVPQPYRVVTRGGRFPLGADTTVVADSAASGVAETLRRYMQPATGLPLNRLEDSSSVPPKGAVVLRLDAGAQALGSEGYRLTVTPENVILLAREPAGLFYALQTLRQLFPPDIYRKAPVAGVDWSAQCVEIEDRPRFGWRGSMLDVSRHFMPLEYLFRYVELLAAHKYNVLQLHLTDDQGWRFPSRRYPRLTEVGAWRNETVAGYRGRGGPDGTPHGGYYGYDDLRELVAYAAERFVTLVPEIDFPGHTRAALAAYPELGNTRERLGVSTAWGIDSHVLNVDDSTLAFCTDVLAEVLEIFPGAFIHTGGDECPRREWEASETAAAKAARLGLPGGVNGLQAWFTAQLHEFLSERARRLIGWDEILDGGPPPGATVMSWRGEEPGVAAARAGHDVVMAPRSHCYFDYYQSDDPREPLAFGRTTTLEEVYAYEPVPAILPPEAAPHILGTQFQVWTEYIPDPGSVEYMAFPRACALAEVAWSNARREWREFSERLSHHLRRLDVLRVNYRHPGGPDPWQQGGTGLRQREPASVAES